MDIISKDLKLQTAFAKSFNLPLLVAHVARQVYQTGRAAGLGNQIGGSAIVKIYKQMAGMSLAAS